jgi:dTDP-4-dehydrorhamnose 3,5-epimerase
MSGKLSVNAVDIHGLYEISTNAFGDHRGIFARWFCDNELKDILKDRIIRNVNFSRTAHAGTVRGLHYQIPPHSEMKIVRCIRGEVLDVAVDIRKGSPTYMQHHAVLLSDSNMKAFVIPEGFAHGFQAMTDDCEIMYLVTEHYSTEHERGLNHADPAIGIEWPLMISEVSDKDRKYSMINSTFEGVTL